MWNSLNLVRCIVLLNVWTKETIHGKQNRVVSPSVSFVVKSKFAIGNDVIDGAWLVAAEVASGVLRLRP